MHVCVRALVSACMLCLCACVLVVFLVCVSNELDTFNGCLSCSSICSCSTAHEEDSGHCFLCALLMFVTGFEIAILPWSASGKPSSVNVMCNLQMSADWEDSVEHSQSMLRIMVN